MKITPDRPFQRPYAVQRSPYIHNNKWVANSRNQQLETANLQDFKEKKNMLIENRIAAQKKKEQLQMQRRAQKPTTGKMFSIIKTANKNRSQMLLPPHPNNNKSVNIKKGVPPSRSIMRSNQSSGNISVFSNMRINNKPGISSNLSEGALLNVTPPPNNKKQSIFKKPVLPQSIQKYQNRILTKS